MITTKALVSTVVRAHYTAGGRVLPAHTYMDLLYDPARALEVQLAGRGLVTGERWFFRQLVADALQSGAAGTGDIQFRLTVPSPLARPVLMVSLDPGQRCAQEYALTRPQSVSAFLKNTYDLVPVRDEPRYVEDAITACLGPP